MEMVYFLSPGVLTPEEITNHFALLYIVLVGCGNHLMPCSSNSVHQKTASHYSLPPWSESLTVVIKIDVVRSRQIVFSFRLISNEKN